MKFSNLSRKITALLTASALALSAVADYPVGFGIASAEAQAETQPIVFVQTVQEPELCPGLGSLYDVGAPISLWGLRGGSTFDGSYYNQLDDNSKKVYDALYAAYVDGANAQNVVFSDISTTFTDVVITRTSKQGTNDQGQTVTYYTDSFSEDFYVQLKEWENNILKPGYLALVYDHPELGWLVNVEYWKSSSSTVYDKNSLQVGENTNVTVEASGFGFYFDEATVTSLEYRGNSAKVNAAVTKAVSAINTDISNSTVRYDIVKGIHDYLCDNLTYYSNQPQLDNFYQTAYSAFYNIDGGTDNLLAVCAGYAKAFKLLCDEYGIPCVYVSGEDNKGGAHGWNYVQMEDGNWYGVDVTWDDQESQTYYQFFLSGSETTAPDFDVTDFGTSHIASGDWANEGYNFVYPTITSDAYVYTEKTSIADAVLSYESNGELLPILQYDGTEKAPTFKVTLNGETLIADTDYTLSGELTGTNAGNYTVTITGKGDYTGTATGKWTITNASAANWTCTTTPATLTYTGNSLSPAITVKDGSTEIPSTEYTIDGVTEATDAGTYTFTITPSANYSETTPKEYTWTINKKTATLMSPAANSLTYNGQPQELVVAGTPTGGTMQYSLDGGVNWSADIPTATNAGDYTVTAMVKGDKNHEDSLTVQIKVTIAPKNISSATITLDKDSYEFDGSTITPVITVKDGETVLTKGTDYALTGNLTATATGNYTITVTGDGNYTGTASKSYSVVKGTIYIDSKDKVNGDVGTGWKLVDGVLTLDEGYNFNVTITDSEKITTVTNNGTIVGGDFGETYLVNNGSVTDGTFYNATNNGTISGGTFNRVYNYESGAISGGTFYMIVCLGGSIVVENESVKTNATVLEPDFNGIDCTVTIDGNEHTHTLVLYSCDYYSGISHIVTYACNECSLNYEKIVYEDHSASKYSASGNVISAACECNHDMGAVITLNAPTDLTYNGKAKEATVTTDLATKPEITYCCKDGCVNAGEHTASVTYEGATAKVDFTIEKLAISNENVKIGTKNFVYTGADRIHSLAIDTIILTINDEEHDIKGQLNVTDTATVFVNVGTYTMTLEAPEDSNFTGTVTADWQITKADITTAVFGDGADENSKEVVFTKEYDGKKDFDTSAIKGIKFGEAAYIFEGFTVTVNAADANVGENKPLTAVITLDNTMKNNFNEASYTVTVTGTITEIAPTYTAPTPKELTYSGENQALVNAGTSEDGTFWYSLTGNNYTTDIPEATDAGTYTVYWKVVGDENHSDVSAKQLEVTIAPMDIKDAVVDVNDEYFFYSNSYKPTEPSVSIDGKTLTKDTDYTLITETIGLDAGEYDVTVAGKGNYTGTATGKATIKKSDLISLETIYYTDGSIATTFSKEYDGKNTFNITDLSYISFENHVNIYTDLNCKNDDSPTEYDIIVEISCKDASVGENKPLTATITIGGEMQKNLNKTSYTLDIPTSVATGTITKVKAKVTAAPTANEVTYSGEAQALITAGTAEGGTMMYSLEENGTYTETIPTATNAGDYKVYYYVKADDDHSDSAVEFIDVTIAPMDIKDAAITFDNPSYTWGEYTPDIVSVVLDGKTLDSNTDYTLITEKIGPNAGAFDVSIEGKGNYTGTATGKALINKADIEEIEEILDTLYKNITVFTKEYDGGVSFDASEVKVVNAEVYLDKCFTISINADDASVGENKPLTATITLTDYMVDNFNKPSYTVKIPTSVATGTITKVKAKVTAAPTANEVTYSGEAQALITAGTAEGGTMMYSLEENGTYTEAIPTATNAGDYKVYYYAKGDNDHDDSIVDYIDVTIEKAEIKATAPAAIENLVYSGKEQAVITAGTASVGTMYYTLTGTDYATTIPEAKDAGTYTVYWKVVGDDNYKDIAEQTFTVTIARSPVTVTAKDAQKVYGDADPAFEVISEGLIGADTLTGKVEREAGDDAGVYAIKQGTITNDSNPNYDITFVEGKLTINKKPVTQFGFPAAPTATYGKSLSEIAIGDWKWEDGTIIPTVTNNGYTAIRTLTDDHNYDYSAIEGYNADTHTVTTTLSVFVTPAALTVAADDKYIIVGAEIPEATYTVTGLVNGDKLVTEPTIGYSGADSSTIGEYEIIVSGAKATENYTLTHKNGKLYVGLCDHEGTTEYLYDSENHWLHCTKCDQNNMSVTAHSGGTADCVSQAVCEACKIPYGKALGHSWATAFSSDDTYHWHNCQNANCPVTDNSKKDGYAAHSYGEWKVETAATATQSGTEKRTCECGASETRTVPPTGVTPPVTTPSATTTPPVYTGTTPPWVNPPAPVTTTTTTVTDTPTTLPPVDDDSDDVDDEIIDDDIDEDDTIEPQIKGENGKMGWEAISDEIADVEEGGKVVVDMNGATKVPEEIFEQIEGLNIDIVIELENGFKWTINGESITEPMDIDLGVNRWADNIPVEVINNVTGECDYLEITLNHEGDFGFTAVLTVDMGDDNEGFFANLYWYTNAALDFICADKISSKGEANLTFTHASEYIIVIDEEDHGKRVEEQPEDGEIDGDTDEVITDEDNDSNPFTAVTLSFTGVIISAAAAVLTRKRKQK